MSIKDLSNLFSCVINIAFVLKVIFVTEGQLLLRDEGHLTWRRLVYHHPIHQFPFERNSFSNFLLNVTGLSVTCRVCDTRDVSRFIIQINF